MPKCSIPAASIAIVACVCGAFAQNKSFSSHTNNLPTPDNIYVEWGDTLTVDDELIVPGYVIVFGLLDGPTSTVNVVGNGVLIAEGIALGHSWWYSGGPNAQLNIYDNGRVNINWMFWGGKVNLLGGLLDIRTGVTDDTVDLVSDATRQIRLSGGTLILWNNATPVVNDWISRGILRGDYPIVIDTVSMPGRTIVTAVPEPGNLSLLTATGTVMLGVLRRKNRESLLTF